MTPIISLEDACSRLTTGLVIRYGNPLFTRMHGKAEDFSKILSTVFSRAEIDGKTAMDLAEWLQQGLRPFSDYPPNIEILIHLSCIIRAQPLTPYQKTMRQSWYMLDTMYGQMYSKSWKGDKPIDEMIRERVWLTEFERLGATEDDINGAMSAIKESGLFRQFAPTLDQFSDAFLSVRRGAPIVEVAWNELADAVTHETHPMVIRTRSAIGYHGLSAQRRDRDMENRFKAAYKKVLTGEIKPELKIIIDNDKSGDRDYIAPEELSARIKDW